MPSIYFRGNVKRVILLHNLETLMSFEFLSQRRSLAFNLLFCSFMFLVQLKLTIKY